MAVSSSSDQEGGSSEGGHSDEAQRDQVDTGEFRGLGGPERAVTETGSGSRPVWVYYFKGIQRNREAAVN